MGSVSVDGWPASKTNEAYLDCERVQNAKLPERSEISKTQSKEDGHVPAPSERERSVAYAFQTFSDI